MEQMEGRGAGGQGTKGEERMEVDEAEQLERRGDGGEEKMVDGG